MQWAGIVLVNAGGEILLNLRSDDPEDAWPNQWDVIGGKVEDGETPDECMVREMREEMGKPLSEFALFKTYEVPLAGGGAAAEFHVYAARLDVPANELLVGEGQEHRFFAARALQGLDIACGTDMVLRDFLASASYQALCHD
jgi:8-oxo-dGTP diphosphatase